MVSENNNFVKQQYDHAYPDGIEHHYWQISRNWIVRKELDKLGQKNLCALDIGCGRGIVVAYLRNNGIDCYGVELSEIELPEGVASFIETGVLAESLDRVKREMFDTLMLLDVIEHIKEPKLFLQNLNDNFPKVNRILVTLPARQELWSNYDEYYGHYKRYTFESVREDCFINGWTIKSIRYSFRTLYLPAYFLSLIGKKRNIDLKTPSFLLKPIHFLAALGLIIEYIILPKNLPGTSIVCVLQRDR